MNQRVILRWDHDLSPCENEMEFRLTYEGPLIAHSDSRRARDRALKVHEMRKKFHPQLSEIWRRHPILMAYQEQDPNWIETMHREGYNWRPIVTERNGLMCRLDILMLRDGPPGKVIGDIDNRLKTVFDALRMPKTAAELGGDNSTPVVAPAIGEDPFFVLLQEDDLITHVSVTADTLLDPVPNVPRDNAVRLVINVAIRPYNTHMENLAFA